MRVIIIANGKGGSAKSTVSANVATYARGVGWRSLLIDADFTQQSLGCWHQARVQQRSHRSMDPLPSVPVIPARIERVADVLEQARDKKADLAIIDTAAGQTSALTRIFELSDLVIIPTQPTLPDIQGAKSTARLAHMLRKPYRFLLTRVTPGHTKRVDLWRHRYDKEGPLLGSQLSNRVAFQDAMVAGMGVSEWSPGCEAAREVTETFEHIRTLLERTT